MVTASPTAAQCLQLYGATNPRACAGGKQINVSVKPGSGSMVKPMARSQPAERDDSCLASVMPLCAQGASERLPLWCHTRKCRHTRTKTRLHHPVRQTVADNDATDEQHTDTEPWMEMDTARWWGGVAGTPATCRPSFSSSETKLRWSTAVCGTGNCR